MQFCVFSAFVNHQRAAVHDVEGWFPRPVVTCQKPKELKMIAFILEFSIATAVAAGVWSAGQPILAVLAWLLIMSFGNHAYEG